MTHHKAWLFFNILILIFLTACSGQKKTQVTSMKILVGTYTQGKSEGIYRLDFNPATGALSNEGLAVKTQQPSFLIVSKDQSRVYAVCETEAFRGQDGGGASAFQWKAGRDELSLMNDQNTRGAHPCYLSLSENGRFLSVANYTGGNFAVFELDKEGQLKDTPQVRQHQGSGPNAQRQEGPHAHCSTWRPDNRYLYVVDLGIDQVVAYSFDQTNGALGEGETALKVEGGKGPRLLAFHPTQKLAFLVNELSSSVLSLSYKESTPGLSVIQEKSTLPGDFQGENSCAHIQLRPDGRFLYVSNRGHDSIAAFSVSPDGKLALVDIEPTQGKTPRFFTITPDGQYLLAANQHSDSVVVFKIDKESGQLEPTGVQAEVYSPVCLQFVN